jgi:hypothetical protein
MEIFNPDAIADGLLLSKKMVMVAHHYKNFGFQGAMKPGGKKF